MEVGRIAAIDRYADEAREWIGALVELLGWHDRHRAWLALAATLHAVRDHLPIDEAAHLGQELPVLLRGLYYEGWHPAGKPLVLDERLLFLERVHDSLHRDPAVDPEHAVRGVLSLLAARLSASELEAVKAVLPAALRGLWPA